VHPIADLQIEYSLIFRGFHPAGVPRAWRRAGVEIPDHQIRRTMDELLVAAAEEVTVSGRSGKGAIAAKPGGATLVMTSAGVSLRFWRLRLVIVLSHGFRFVQRFNGGSQAVCASDGILINGFGRCLVLRRFAAKSACRRLQVPQCGHRRFPFLVNPGHSVSPVWLTSVRYCEVLGYFLTLCAAGHRCRSSRAVNCPPCSSSPPLLKGTACGRLTCSSCAAVIEWDCGKSEIQFILSRRSLYAVANNHRVAVTASGRWA
jgi:hypothetical protein